MKKTKQNGFEKRESLGKKYWQDDRWVEVRELRIAGEDLRANGLVMEIRADWGID